MSESVANFVLNEAKNGGIAYPPQAERLFDEVQDKICRLQPFEALVEQVF